MAGTLKNYQIEVINMLETLSKLNKKTKPELIIAYMELQTEFEQYKKTWFKKKIDHPFHTSF